MPGRYEITPSYSLAQQVAALDKLHLYLYEDEDGDYISEERLAEIREECSDVAEEYYALQSQLYETYDIYVKPTKELVRLLVTYFLAYVEFLKFEFKIQDQLPVICLYWFNNLKPMLDFQADNNLVGFFRYLSEYGSVNEEEVDRNQYFVEKIKEYGPVEL